MAKECKVRAFKLDGTNGLRNPVLVPIMPTLEKFGLNHCWMSIWKILPAVSGVHARLHVLKFDHVNVDPDALILAMASPWLRCLRQVLVFSPPVSAIYNKLYATYGKASKAGTTTSFLLNLATQFPLETFKISVYMGNEFEWPGANPFIPDTGPWEIKHSTGLWLANLANALQDIDTEFEAYQE
ncbi:hypothetical protein P154DRAFT_569289 [Amniculicola lignicola CBS 123094]|uniref:Uncharacterized protein n=1 Tax=Amniculicola lignicola CBS 123094 TaxID=1392246 RepID=A0A6A5X3B5_9PLEO|nr:hypothetical protein P154DRAFT_569289 [Amniculicola lignicola CBS 123094]